MNNPIAGKITEEKLMEDLDIKSRTTILNLRKSGLLKCYQFGDCAKNYYDLEEVKMLFKEKRNG